MSQYKWLRNQNDSMKSDLHDNYAAEYDRQVSDYGCHIAEVLFGLCYEFVQPGQYLLEAGIGSGLCAALFSKAGLVIHGFDFSQDMLDLCLKKGFAAELKKHDLVESPWPYPSDKYDILISCGVFHFILDLEGIFSEAQRILRPSGIFAFTTKISNGFSDSQKKYLQQMSGEFEIFSHSISYIHKMLETNHFESIREQQCLAGTDTFQTWVTRKQTTDEWN